MAVMSIIALDYLSTFVLPADKPQTLLKKPTIVATCVGARDEMLGVLTIKSLDNGQNALLKINGEETTLPFIGQTWGGETYSDGHSELIFDGEIRVNNLFGKYSGFCGLG